MPPTSDERRRIELCHNRRTGQAIAGARTVDVHVAQVRGKLGDGSPIRTVRGVGYAAEQR